MRLTLLTVGSGIGRDVTDAGGPADLCALAAGGARILPPLLAGPIESAGGQVATIWPMASTGRTDAGDLADIFRSVHSCPDPGLDQWDPRRSAGG